MNKCRLNCELSSHKGTRCPFNRGSGVIKLGIDRRKEGGFYAGYALLKAQHVWGVDILECKVREGQTGSGDEKEGRFAVSAK
jgi:hypothetical protein